MLPLLTQPLSQYPPLVYAPDALDSTPPGSRKDLSDATRLAIEGNLPRDRVTAADYKLFGGYQDWVHQNPGTHMYGGIE